MIALIRTWSAILSVAALAFSLGGTAAWAQLTSDEELGRDKDVVFHAGGAVRLKPRYEGADSYIVYPIPLLAVSVLRLPGVGDLSADGSRQGFFFYPSFDFVGERTASSSPILSGLNDVDWAVELGAGFGYRIGMIRGFVEVRKGVNGHSGWIFDTGLDLVKEINPQWTLSGGLRASFADNSYMDTYFGVTPAESGPSIFPAYDPGGGIKSAGVAGIASYRWTNDVTVHFQAGYDRLIGDAGDSPIVAAGSTNQFSLTFGLTRRFSMNLD
jgi:outer membrane protein